MGTFVARRDLAPELRALHGGGDSLEETFRERLIEILGAVESERDDGVLRVGNGAGRLLGQLIVRAGQVCFAISESAPTRRSLGDFRALARLARSGNRAWCDIVDELGPEGLARLRLEARQHAIDSLAAMAIALERDEPKFDFAAVQSGYDPRLAFSPSELLFRVVSATVPSCEADAATALFTRYDRSGQPAILLRRPDDEGARAFPLAGHDLDAAPLRHVMRISRAISEVLRDHGAQSPTYAVVVDGDVRWVCAPAARHLIGVARGRDQPVEPVIAAVVASRA